MKKLMILAAMAAMFAGCSVTKVEYEQGDNGKVSYRLYRNSHWLKTEGEGMRGGMTSDGKFEFDLEGLKSSPSEEFNRTMMTYTSAFVQLAQIAAAAYNPSASAAIQSAAAKSAQSTNPPILQSSNQSAAANSAQSTTPPILQSSNQSASTDCKDGTCTTGTCTDGSCSDTTDCANGSCSDK